MEQAIMLILGILLFLGLFVTGIVIAIRIGLWYKRRVVYVQEVRRQRALEQIERERAAKMRNIP